MTEFKPVVFSVGEQEYGVDIGLVQGIENIIQVVPIPNSNPNIRGIINLRGEVIPVYSLRKKFNLPPQTNTENAKFIIVKVDSMLLALEVDKVDEIQNVADGMSFEVPIIVKSKDTGYADQIISVNGRLIVIINVKNLMSDMERSELTSMVSNLS